MVGRLRSWARRATDILATLRALLGLAALTAVATIAVNLTLIPRLPIPDAFTPIQGFVIAALISGVVFLATRGRRHERLARAASAATALLDGDLVLAWQSSHVPRRELSLRILAGEARRNGFIDFLEENVGIAEVGSRIQEFVGDFERSTSHDAGTLWPPRANSRVSEIIRRGADVVVATDAYVDRARELVHSDIARDLVRRHEALAITAGALAGALLATVTPAEDLEELADPKTARAAAADRDRLAAEKTNTQRNVQRTLAAAAEELERAIAPPETPVETLTKQDLAGWRERIGAGQRQFQEAVANRGEQMHSWTHQAWVATNDAVNDVDRELADLLRTGDGERVAETAAAIATKRERLAAAVARLRAIKL